MTEHKRKRIPDLCNREAKGATTNGIIMTTLFSFEGGAAKVLPSKEEHRDQEQTSIDLGKFSQVLRGSASGDLIAETSYFVFNSLEQRYCSLTQ